MALNYEIHRSPDGTTGWTFQTFVAEGVQTYDDTGLDAGTQYFYRIRAVDTVDSNLFSDWVEDNATTGKLVAHWKLDDNAATTNVTDELGVNNGTIVGGKTTDAMSVVGAGPGTGSALAFDGVGDSIDVGSSFSTIGSVPYSIVLWLKTNSSSGVRTMVSKHNAGVGGEWRVYQNATRVNVAREVSPWQISGTFDLVLDRWYHIVATYDGSDLRLYMDSLLDAGPIAFGAITGSPQPVRVGSGLASSVEADFFDGSLDEVGLYNYALTQTEIDQIYADATIPPAIGFNPLARFVGGF